MMERWQQVAERTNSALRCTVAMVGMMGSGKTAVGSEVARRLDVPFIDSDHEIEKAANATISEIFERDGEPFFRDKETQVLTRLLKGLPCILSTGGGAFLAERNRALIAEHGKAVWLDADVDLLWSRVRHKKTRPLLLTENPRKTLEEIYDARVPLYSKAQVQVQARPEYSISDMANEVVRALAGTPGVLRKGAEVSSGST
jgi:shikimate kinase